MKSKTIRWLVILVLVSLPVLVITATGSAISGASFTIFNAHVEDPGNDICKNSDTACNIFAAKEYVWLNGGPNANIFGADGVYFFAVLEPGGQPNPNDSGGVEDKNLSDDYDCYQNRVFNVRNGEVSAYTGNIDCSSVGYPEYNLFAHWLDSGRNEPGLGNQKPNNLTPNLRLYPFSEATNSGGTYILVVCRLDEGYPVDPRKCKYDAFKVQQVDQPQFSFFLDGYDESDPGLGGWKIFISGIGPDGSPIEAEVSTDELGYWSYQSNVFIFQSDEKPREVNLKVCEETQSGWTQSFPDGDGCREIDFRPAGFDRFVGVNFANWLPVSLTACTVQDLDSAEGGETIPLEDWIVSLTQEGTIISSKPTGSDGCYTWYGLKSGSSYDIHAERIAGWQTLGTADRAFLWKEARSGESLRYTFVNVPLQGCSPDFWRGNSEYAATNGQRLWDAPDDPDWRGLNNQPFNRDTNFCEFFGGCIGDKSMNYYLDMQYSGLTGGADQFFNKAAHSLVAAYLNASWGMNYAYSTTQLHAKWTAAIQTREDLSALAVDLESANAAYERAAGGPNCPVGNLP